MHSIEFRQVEDTKDITILEFNKVQSDLVEVTFGGNKVAILHYPAESLLGTVILVLEDKEMIENYTGGNDTFTFESDFNAKKMLRNFYYSL